MALSDDDVREILRIIDESPLDELKIETEGFSLHVRRGGSPGTSPPRLEPQAAPASEDGPTNVIDRPEGELTVESPMLGTFYRAESPGQDPFVEVGSRVEPDTTVCIIEVMKMMNSVPAGVAGTIVEVCRQNAELVEYGEPLFRIDPAG
jgi:acetyl-CoA carboxylase biotin carboxyl carrier protein